MEEHSLAEAVESTGLLEAVEHDLSFESTGAVVADEGNVPQQLDTVQDADFVKLTASDGAVKPSEESSVQQQDVWQKRRRVTVKYGDAMSPTLPGSCDTNRCLRLGAGARGEADSIHGVSRKRGKSKVEPEGVHCDSSDIELHISESPSRVVFSSGRETLMTGGREARPKADDFNSEAVPGYLPHRLTAAAHLDSSLDAHFGNVAVALNMSSDEDIPGSCRPGDGTATVMQVTNHTGFL